MMGIKCTPSYHPFPPLPSLLLSALSTEKRFLSPNKIKVAALSTIEETSMDDLIKNRY